MASSPKVWEEFGKGSAYLYRESFHLRCPLLFSFYKSFLRTPRRTSIMHSANETTPTYNLTVFSPGPGNPRQSITVDRTKIFKHSTWIRQRAGSTNRVTLNLDAAFDSDRRTWYLLRCFVYWLVSGKIETKLRSKDTDAGYLELGNSATNSKPQYSRMPYFVLSAGTRKH
jgi:hypothetical protein